jgi:Ca2+-binding RTX toxin-like protein
MATIILGQGINSSFGFQQFSDIRFTPWKQTAASTNTLTYESGAFQMVLDGAFDSGSSGVVSGLTIYKGAGVAYRAEGFVLHEAASFLDYVLGKDFASDPVSKVLSGNDVLTGSALNDSIHTFAGNDRIEAGAGDDYIDAGAGSDIVDGGDGFDTASAGGGLADFRVERVGDGFVLTNLLDGSVDTYTNVERINFGLRFLAADIDVDNAGGQVFRLYQAAFDRLPDQLGLSFWMAHLGSDLSLVEMADGFIHSWEYQQHYAGGLDNRDLVARYYDNILHRAPDQGGLDYWSGLLDSGKVTNAQVLAAISESQENIENSAAVIGRGVIIDYFMGL